MERPGTNLVSGRSFLTGTSGIALVDALAAMLWLKPATLATGGLLAVLSGLYMIPPGKHRTRLKKVWYLKPLVISGAWAVGGVLLPVLEAEWPITVPVIGLIGYRLLFVLPNTLLAAWPDRQGDTRAGLRAIPFK